MVQVYTSAKQAREERVELVEGQDVAGFEEGCLQYHDVCGFEACFLVDCVVFAGASEGAAKQCVGRGWRNQRVAGAVIVVDVIADGGEPEVIVVKGLTK